MKTNKQLKSNHKKQKSEIREASTIIAHAAIPYIIIKPKVNASGKFISFFSPIVVMCRRLAFMMWRNKQ